MEAHVFEELCAVFGKALTLPADDPMVRQLARAARGLVLNGRLLLGPGRGYGGLNLEFVQGRYKQCTVLLRGPIDREEPGG